MRARTLAPPALALDLDPLGQAKAGAAGPLLLLQRLYKNALLFRVFGVTRILNAITSSSV